MEDSMSAVGILVDLSEPDPQETYSENKENAAPVNGPSETSNSNEDERRLSLTLEKPNTLEDRILKDVTQNIVGNSSREMKKSQEIAFLDEEKFDFDLILSPDNRTKTEEDNDVGEDEEIFFGPVGFTERLVAATVPLLNETKSMSPLNPLQLAEMVKEAQLVACHIASLAPGESSDEGVSTQPIKCKLFSPNSKNHARKGTFKVDEEDVKRLPAKVRQSIPCIDFDLKNNKNELSNSQCVQSYCQETENRSSDVLSDSWKTESTTDTHGSSEAGVTKPSEVANKMSRLSKLTRNRSYTLLKKAQGSDAASETETGLRTRHYSSSSDTASETCSVASDNSDVSFTRPNNQIRRSMQKTLKAPVAKSSQDTNKSIQGGMTTGLRRPSGLVKPGTKSGLTAKNLQRAASADSKHRRTLSNSSNSSVSSTASNKSSVSANGSTLPVKKLQLIGQGNLQRNSLAFGRNKLTELKKKSGPMKAVAPVPELTNGKGASPPRSKAKREATRCTPVKQDKLVKPRALSGSFGTPSSGYQNSVSQSTPVSEKKGKRRSFLPTPSKSSTSSVPASPFSARSSVSSNSSVGSHKSLSFVGDSPVFVLKRQPSFSRKRNPSTKGIQEVNENSPTALKSRRPLVQHTPDIPKQAPSRWSPMRRNRQLSQDDQAIQCTKRLPRLGRN